MAVRIRLKRMGKIRNPQYRIVVADARTKRDGRAIENLGIYHPKEEPSRIEVNSERVQYWLSVGAQPSEPVKALLRRTGDWQKFKGLPMPTKPVQVAPPKTDKHAVYEAEAKAAAALAEKEREKKEKEKAAAKEKAARERKGRAKAAEGKAETGAEEQTAPEATAEQAAEATAAQGDQDGGQSGGESAEQA